MRICNRGWHLAKQAPAAPSVADPARLTAYHVLARADAGHRINDALYQGLSGAELSDRERRFVTELVMGTTRMRRRLDADLARCYRGRYGRIESGVKRLLRLGAYQLLFMDGVPAHAALNTTVELAQAVRLARASGIVNGVLRQLTRQPPPGKLPATASTSALADAFSHPEWLVERWQERLGREQAMSLMAWNNRPPTIWLRLRANLQKRQRLAQLAGESGTTLQPHALLSNYVTATPSPAPLLIPEVLQEGLFIVQDPSSGAVVQAVDPQPGETIIDLCAGPGGKTAALADSVGPHGRILAYERDNRRIGMLRDTLNRLGLDNVDIFPGDATARELPPADKILVDTPCTGTGVMSRRADLRWRRQPEHLAELAALQLSLLTYAAGQLRPGGILVYATCSLEPEENWNLVETFQGRQPQFGLLPLPEGVPRSWQDGNGALCSFPPQHEVDGMFAVRLKDMSSGDAAS